MRLIKEKQRAREKETLALVEKAVEGRPEDFRYISVIHDVFEHDGTMYCLAETWSNLGDLDVFLVVINKEGVLELVHRNSIQMLKEKYWEYMEKLKN